MIRDENLAMFLKCILEVMDGTFKPQLESLHSKSLVDALVAVLGRMIADADESRIVAAERLGTWESIERQFAESVLPGAARADVALATAENPIHAIENRTHRMQSVLLNTNNYAALVAALRRGDAGATSWLKSTAIAYDDLLQNFEKRFYRPKGRKGMASVADNLDQLESRLNAYLCRRYPGLPAKPIEKLTIVPGGQIKRTAIIRLRENALIPTRIVLRQDMDMEYTGTTVTDEFVIIKRVFDLGLPVPEPILVEADPNVLGDGGCFMIMTEVVDAVPSGTYFGEDRAIVGHNMGPEFGRELAAALGRLHGLTRDTSPDASERVRSVVMGNIEKFKAVWHKQSKPAFTFVSDLGWAWLDAHPLAHDRPLCLRHGDTGSHNMMSRDGHLAALIDWELAHMGDPAADLAQVKLMLTDFMMPWEEFKQVYIANGGPPEACSDQAIAFFGVWTFSYHLSMATNLWDNFNKGVRDDAAAAGVASHSIDRLNLYLARALAYAVKTVG
jgi:aminoglycoside phosphotransferase (APT) family kinase protein